VSGVLPPAVIASALQVYRAQGTYASAARAVGCDESTVRKALRRHTAPERWQIMADALDDAHEAALATVVLARQRTVAALEVSDDVRAVALLSHTLHEGLRAVTTARAAHGRIVVDVQPEPESADDDALAAKLDGVVAARLRERLERIRRGAAESVLAMPAEQLAERVAERVRALLVLVASGDSDAAASLAVVLEG
jgi:hypothetical protein